ncbi:DUF983 domain-containing protein [Luteithermobacter gelatinilyticus]|uniref:DUF983 domain-containing protein n=1 Tax=Luteithermobacter gelatinilyticus TaxID=2582913 RepID=UPI001106CE94|nr:DUF983 domain-containing protein [Luteithermobacter gelatinilyticus]
MTDSDTKFYGRKDTLFASIAKGLRRACPQCGTGRIFAGYLKLKPACPSCQAPIGEIRADDFPPYLTIFLVGHIVVPLLVYVEAAFQPPTWVQITVWPLISLILALAFLPYLKGGVVGLMWSLDLKGDERH